MSRWHHVLSWLGLSLCLISAPCSADPLERGFTKPPLEARPWVYWFWLNGNITSNGITADLEAMHRVGIGGVLIMEVDQGAPVGPVDFASSQWRALFKHAVSEARRLGLAINLNNDAGWNGSGGPWIKPEQSMQKVVWSETNLTGPSHFEATLPQPETVAGFYRDLAVFAIPAVGTNRINRIEAKALFKTESVGDISEAKFPPEAVVDHNAIHQISECMGSSGRLVWDVPPGEWTLLRFGHTSTGVENAPAPKSGRGLECDKLSPEGIEANFAGLLGKLVGDKPGRTDHGGTGLVATHIDSWENGAQNWTARMREEFRKRRGYDLFPFLPVLTGRAIDSLEVSERFLWDLRRTVSDLVVENYAGHMRDLAHAHGLRFTVEAYGSPCDNLPYGGQSDEPMGEFWSPSGAMETCKGMAGCAHVYGKPIVGAEAFTAGDSEKWRQHPATLKALGDQAFCEGINRFVFHRYALQPWAEDRRPGMMMGPWGQHYERTQTWWDQTASWHEYLARCQFLLRQGQFAADICYLQPEMPPQGFGNHPRKGYDWDECNAQAVLSRMSAAPGRIVLPDGMSYRMLVLPQTRWMTPQLLRKLKDLVLAGATVLGLPPKKSPSLSDYPQCDEQVKQLAAELWENCDGEKVREHRFGQGQVIWGSEPEKVLRDAGVPPDFSSGEPLRFIHRIAGSTDIYFVANCARRHVITTGTFRTNGKVPELWWPDTGRMERAPLYQEKNSLTSVALTLEPSGSVFVIFRGKARHQDPLVNLSREGKPLLSAIPEPPPPMTIHRAVYGVPEDPQHSRDVREAVQRKVDTADRSFRVATLGESDDPAPNVVKTLSIDYSIQGKQYSVKAQDPTTIHLSEEVVKVTVTKARYGVLEDPKRTRDVREKLQRLVDAGESTFLVSRMAEGDDPAVLVVKRLEFECTRDGTCLSLNGQDPDLIDLRPPVVDQFERIAEVHRDAAGRPRLTAFRSGRYNLETAAGNCHPVTVSSLPAPLAITGPWRVEFAPHLGAPGEVTLEQLDSWTSYQDPGVRYFSGSAKYTKTIEMPAQMLGRNKRLFLDLGRVEVIAQVKLNGQDLGRLWKPPFRVEITSAAKPGANKLEVVVVNLWPNRMIGDDQLGEDSERNDDGSLKAWPTWLQAGKASPAGRCTFATWRLWKKSDALLESGLLGPVTISPAVEIKF